MRIYTVNKLSSAHIIVRLLWGKQPIIRRRDTASMSPFSFLFTQVIILLCIVAVTVLICCFFAVARKESLIFLSVFFGAYCTEMYILLLGEFQGFQTVSDALTTLSSRMLNLPLLRLLISFLLCVGAWEYSCSVLNIRHLGWRIGIPITLFLAQSTILIVVPERVFQQMLFYAIREIAAIVVVAALLMRQSFASEQEPGISKRQSRLLSRAFVILILVFVEEIVTCPAAKSLLSLNKYIAYFFFSRNVFENLIVGFCAYHTVSDGIRMLSARLPHSGSMQVAFDTRVAQFGKQFMLTEREVEVVSLLLYAKSNQEIATELVLSIGTVKSHVSHIYGKTGIHSRQDLAQLFWETT